MPLPTCRARGRRGVPARAAARRRPACSTVGAGDVRSVGTCCWDDGPRPASSADYPLSRLTTVGTGGPARFLARPATDGELAEVLAVGAAPSELDVAVVGLGSNLLVADEGYDGVVAAPGRRARPDRARRRTDRLRRRRLARGDRAAGDGLGPLRDRVRLRHPRHGRRRGADERGRLRRRDARRARARRSWSAPTGSRRGGPDELGMRYRHSNVGPRRGGRRGGAAAAAGRPRADPGDGRRHAAAPARGPAGQGAHVRLVWKNPPRRALGRPPARGVRAEGLHRRAAPASRRCTPTSSRTWATPGRPTSSR